MFLKSLAKTLLVLGLSSLLFACQKQDPAIEQVNTFISEANIDKSKGDWNRDLPKPPKLAFTPDKTYLWNLETNKGLIKIALKPEASPMHVSSTIYLTQLGFYDNLTFHRVISKFMAQGGDPLGNGMGGPGYTYLGEFDSNLSHDKAGILSMANAGAGTDGSQFFITFKATPHLDGKHTIFGEVVSGMESLKAIEALGSRRGKTKEKIFIKKATIEVSG